MDLLTGKRFFLYFLAHPSNPVDKRAPNFFYAFLDCIFLIIRTINENK